MDRSTSFSLVDADVHNYPNALADLMPFLSARWQAYAKQSGLQLPGVSIYPKVFAAAARRDRRARPVGGGGRGAEGGGGEGVLAPAESDVRRVPRRRDFMVRFRVFSILKFIISFDSIFRLQNSI